MPSATMVSPMRTPAPVNPPHRKMSFNSPMSPNSIISSIGPSISQRGSAPRPQRPVGNPSLSSRSLVSQVTISENATLIGSGRKPSIPKPVKPLRSVSGWTIAGGEVAHGSNSGQLRRPEEVDLMSLTVDAPAEENGVDHIFVAFGIRDVALVQERARESAIAKQEELRMMVGERYRDLLSAADSIVRMRTSASQILDRLDASYSGCDKSDLEARAKAQSFTAQQPAEGRTPYTLAMLVKLLLDCPEHVWRAIENGDFLSAARLESLSRVVHSELVGTGEDEEEVDVDVPSVFPLIERHWDTMSQLESQIVRRAMVALRRWREQTWARGIALSDNSRTYADPLQTVVQTLAAVVMLEKLSIPEAFALILRERSGSLDAILNSSTPPKDTVMGSPTLGKKASASRAADDIILHLKDALGLTLATTRCARTVFDELGRTNLCLKVLLEGLQAGEIDVAESSTEETSIRPILQSLPNAHLLMRHLPSSITNFTPFIDTSSSRNDLKGDKVEEELHKWFDQRIQQLRNAFEVSLHSLTSATQLATVRDAIGVYLDSDELACNTTNAGEMDAIRSTFDAALRTRLAQLYRSELDDIANVVEPILKAALLQLSSSPEDLSPPNFVFSSSIPFPVVPTVIALFSASNPKQPVSPFHSFSEAISKRLSGRPPLMDGCLSQLEQKARHFRMDLSEWLITDQDKACTCTKIANDVKATFNQILATISALLEDSAKDVDRSLFIGNFSIILASASSFSNDLAVPMSSECTSVVASFETKLRQLQQASMDAWTSKTVHDAASIVESELQRLLSRTSSSPDSTGEDENSIPHEPSTSLMTALYSLVEAALRLGNRELLGDRLLLQSVIESFNRSCAVACSATLVSSSQSLQVDPNLAKQLLLDIAFLRLLRGVEAESDEAWSSTEKRLVEQLPDLGSVEFRASVEDRALASLQRCNSLLAILLPPPASTAEASTQSNRLSVVTPRSQHISRSTEVRNPIARSTPGPRFGLLPVPESRI